MKVIVIGAGVGGLATGAVLARRGLEVTVLEAHVYPGGCAGTFYHQGYRFDAGATLAGGFYPGGPMDLLAQAAGIESWPARPGNPAMVVHLPGVISVSRGTDEAYLEEYETAFGRDSLAFWRWQESTADRLWDLALRLPDWPPQSTRQLLSLAGTGLKWLGVNWPRRLDPIFAADAFRPVSSHLNDMPEILRLFVDAQLLISTQTTSQNANALYAAAALDLPRRGVVHLEGGMGAVAARLVQAVRDAGGRVLFRQQVRRIRIEPNWSFTVETKRGEIFTADLVVANLTPWNILDLMESDAPASLRRLPRQPQKGWGAFTLYLGLDRSAIPDGFALHHQVIRARPLGEGNSVFISLSPEWDHSRAPEGCRAVTLSTHTELSGWWDLFEQDRATYEARKQAYQEKLLDAADQILPGIRQSARLVLPGTPVTFQRFTRRGRGWVGGFPQVDLFQALPARLAPGLWMVGDSIFPGQSTAAVALGGLRVAREILQEYRLDK